MKAVQQALPLPVIVLLALLAAYGWAMTGDYNEINQDRCAVAAQGE